MHHVICKAGASCPPSSCFWLLGGYSNLPRTAPTLPQEMTSLAPCHSLLERLCHTHSTLPAETSPVALLTCEKQLIPLC